MHLIRLVWSKASHELARFGGPLSEADVSGSSESTEFRSNKARIAYIMPNELHSSFDERVAQFSRHRGTPEEAQLELLESRDPFFSLAQQLVPSRSKFSERGSRKHGRRLGKFTRRAHRREPPP